MRTCRRCLSLPWVRYTQLLPRWLWIHTEATAEFQGQLLEGKNWSHSQVLNIWASREKFFIVLPGKLAFPKQVQQPAGFAVSVSQVSEEREQKKAVLRWEGKAFLKEGRAAPGHWGSGWKAWLGGNSTPEMSSQAFMSSGHPTQGREQDLPSTRKSSAHIPVGKERGAGGKIPVVVSRERGLVL